MLRFLLETMIVFSNVGRLMIRNSDENGLLESSGIALLVNLILSVYTFDFMLP